MSAEITGRLKNAAQELGFVLSGACAAATPEGWRHLQDWLAAGHAGEMRYLQDRREAYSHPQHVLPGVRSLFLLAFPYRTVEPKAPLAGEGQISRYAWSDHDYHDVIHDRLRRLAEQLRAWCPGASVRGVVDTAPLLERDFARRAGLGWIGKNTMLIHRSAGSWFFLAALLTDLKLEPDSPHTTDHCGTCRACLDACPTAAFPQPYVLDARRCVSYLTIELRGPIPTELREPLGNWTFGCDVCQDVCPWNRRAPADPSSLFQPAEQANPLELSCLFELDEAGFRRRFRHTPFWRAKRRGILRNAAIVLGNQRWEAAIPALTLGLDDQEPLVRGASAWALGRIGTRDAHETLRRRAAIEQDREVVAEIQAALSAIADNSP